MVERYRYYNRATNALNLSGLLEDIGNAPNGSVVLLHACAHNPTGCDPTHDEWKTICELIQTKHLIAFFDSAYQGFASGNAEQDAWALRYFVKQGVPVLLAQSFAKNFGLYGERCGTLSVICDSAEQREIAMSQLRLVIRPMYSNPPKHGSSIVRTILSDEKLTAQYYTECSKLLYELYGVVVVACLLFCHDRHPHAYSFFLAYFPLYLLEMMADRIAEMRTKLVSTLEKVGSTHDWSHVTNQIGMFAYTGCNKEMCDLLTEKYAIFLTKDGRISIAGLNDGNVEYVAKAIYDVTEGKPITLEE